MRRRAHSAGPERVRGETIQGDLDKPQYIRPIMVRLKSTCTCIKWPPSAACPAPPSPHLSLGYPARLSLALAISRFRPRNVQRHKQTKMGADWDWAWTRARKEGDGWAELLCRVFHSVYCEQRGYACPAWKWAHIAGYYGLNFERNIHKRYGIIIIK